jgi:Tetratricopeptide repeat.
MRSRSAYFDAAIDRNPYVAPPYQARGQSLIAVGKFDAAVEDFNSALNVDNKSADTWALRGVALDRVGKKTEAQESFQRALVIDGSNRIAKQGLSGSRGGLF